MARGMDARRRALLNRLCWLLAPLLLSIAAAADSPIPLSYTRLSGHFPPALKAARLCGRLRPTERVDLAIALPVRNPSGLNELMQGLYDPASPAYGRYLTPDQFADRFCPTKAQYAAAMDFARASGLHIDATHPNRLLLDVSGPASAVEAAFHLDLLRYQEPGGRTFRAPSVEPAVPASLAGTISGVIGLDTAAVWHPSAIAVPPAPWLAATPNAGSGPGGGLTPADIRAAYNLTGIANAGAGRTLGLFELTGYRPADITAYETAYGLPNVPLQNVLVDGFNGAPGYGVEEVTLDIQLQIALAPAASKIIVYEGPNTGSGVVDTYNRIATDNLCKEISVSWGLCETSSSAAMRAAESAAFQQMAAQGQSIFAASGDSGAYDNRSTLSVDDPASQPYMVGVGGTALTTNGRGGPWLSETTWNGGSISGGGGGGGISALWPIPSYQTGLASPASKASATMRNVPDVALDSHPGTGYSIYCGGWVVYGGTSCAAPLWSAFMAIVNQKRLAAGGAVIGFANPALYNVARCPRYAQDFHDIADGSTNLYYPAVTGYDCATGLGSFNGAYLLAELSAAGAPAAPFPPAGLKAAAGAGTITLTWTASAGATKYAVYCGASPGGESATPLAADVATTSYIHTGVTNGATWYYTVTAVNAVGESMPSNEAAATYAPPPAPTSLKAIPGAARAVLTWNASAGAAKYKVYAGSASGSEAPAAIATVTGLTYTNTGLAAGSTWYYKVTAQNALGEGDPSLEASATLTPPAPAGLKAAGGSKQITLTWTAANGATAYNVFAGSTAGGEAPTPIAAGLTSATFTQTGLPDGAARFYKVTAVNAGGESARSAEATATTVPPAPTNLVATPGLSKVTLTWNAAPGATRYNVYAGTAAGAEAGTPVASGISGVTYNHTALVNGTAHFYKVSAVNPAGESALSAEAGATLIPSAPTALKAMPGNGQVALTWSPSIGATTYNVFAGSAPGGEDPTPLATGVTDVAYVQKGLAPGALRYYKVTAVGVSGESPRSTEASGTTVPAPPAGLRATAGTGKATLTWTASAGAARYNVYMGTASGAEGTTPVATVSGTTYNNTGLTNGRTYYYRVSAFNAAGDSGPGDEAMATLVPSAPTAVKAAGARDQITLSWAACVGAVSYNVYAGTAPGAEDATALATGITDPAFVHGKLGTGAPRYYKVTAVNSGGESPRSAEASAATVPAAPTGLLATAGAGKATLTWTACPGATKYAIYAGTAAGAESPTPVATVAGTLFNHSGLAKGATYYYKVTALNPAGESDAGDEASATLIPAVPLALKVTAGTGRASLAWTASAGAATYNVYRGSAAGAEAAAPVATGVASAAYTDTGLASGAPCYYKVTAVNAGGESARSNESFGVTAPAPPTGLTATPSNAKVTLAWTASAGATKYNVYAGAASGAEGATPIATVSGLTYAHVGLTNGAACYYRVTATNAAGESAASTEATGTPVAPPVVQLLANPGFESGPSDASWTGAFGLLNGNVLQPAHAGAWNVSLCGRGTAGTSSLAQTVTIPAGAIAASLSFWLHVDSSEASATLAADTLKVQITDANGVPLRQLGTYSNLNKGAGYSQKSFDLLALKGRAVRVYLLGTENSSAPTTFTVDDFALNCQ